MPDFANPFVGNVPDRKMTVSELVRALRLDIAAEEEAAATYEAHADATDNPIARKVLLDVANEERVHVGEFTQLIELLTGDEKAWMENGFAEVLEMAAEVAKGDLEPATPAEKAEEEGIEMNGDEEDDADYDKMPTIGSLRQ